MLCPLKILKNEFYFYLDLLPLELAKKVYNLLEKKYRTCAYICTRRGYEICAGGIVFSAFYTRNGGFIKREASLFGS